MLIPLEVGQAAVFELGSAAHDGLEGDTTATQVLHSSPELGGDAVQEACGDTPGVYVGNAHTSHAQPLSTCTCAWQASVRHHVHESLGLPWPKVGMFALKAQELLVLGI